MNCRLEERLHSALSQPVFVDRVNTVLAAPEHCFKLHVTGEIDRSLYGLLVRTFLRKLRAVVAKEQPHEFWIEELRRTILALSKLLTQERKTREK